MPVSIAIPFYNAEKYLPDAIRSVFAQTYQDWELILIDDGSTDGSLEIAESVKDSRVRVISDGNNFSLAERLNQVTSLAKYDLIARMDADDLMSPNRIEKQVAILDENPEIDLVSTGLYSVTNNLTPIGCRWPTSDSITLPELINRKGCGVVHAAIVARKSWYQRNQYNTKLKVAQDYDLWLRSGSNNDFHIRLLQEPLYYYREEGNVRIKKMLRAVRNERGMYRKYAIKHKMKLIAKSYFKSCVILSVFILNQQNRLLKRRSSPITDPMLLGRFEREIKQIKATVVCGLK